MKRTVIILSCVLMVVCVCGGLSQTHAQEKPKNPVNEFLEMIVDADGMKDEDGVRSVYPGDAVYLILSLKNISQSRRLAHINPVWSRSDTSGIAKLRVLDDDSVYTFYRERAPYRSYTVHVLKGYTPPPLLLPGQTRQVLVERIELPPLEDQKSPFWMAIRQRLETELFVACEMDVEARSNNEHSPYHFQTSIPIRIYRRAALMPVEESKAVPDIETVRRQQGDKEMALLDHWLDTTPAYFLPVKDKYGRQMSEEGDLAMFPPGANPSGDKKRMEFSLLHTDITRKPISPNAPEYPKDWWKLERQFSPSTVRDEIQLRRMVFERVYASNNQKRRDEIHRDLISWLMTLPYAQRTIMANDFDLQLPEEGAPKK